MRFLFHSTTHRRLFTGRLAPEWYGGLYLPITSDRTLTGRKTEFMRFTVSDDCYRNQPDPQGWIVEGSITLVGTRRLFG